MTPVFSYPEESMREATNSRPWGCSNEGTVYGLEADPGMVMFLMIDWGENSAACVRSSPGDERASASSPQCNRLRPDLMTRDSRA